MARGHKKHLKRINAPHHWMLDKLSGKYAPRPSQGPHKLRECLPLVIFLRNRLKYALNLTEVKKILTQRSVLIDGKVRTDPNYPAGFMDVISIPKANENFRLLFEPKGRFAVHRITKKEAMYKLCKIRKVAVGPHGIPFATTHDGRTIRFPHPNIKANDTVIFDLTSGTVKDFIKFEVGNSVMITGGHSTGRVGTIVHRERHPGSFEIVHVKDNIGHTFVTRLSNVFVIGKGDHPLVSIPKGNGVRLSVIEERAKRLGARVQQVA